jgi:thiol-disulfide isomerase/thioredoxin
MIVNQYTSISDSFSELFLSLYVELSLDYKLALTIGAFMPFPLFKYAFNYSLIILLTGLLTLPVNTISAATQKPAYTGTDWVLNNLQGKPVRLSDFQGRPVILVFWATWCPYCKLLLPGIAELNNKYESRGLKVLAVNIMEDWKPAVYWRNHEYKFDTVIDGDNVAAMYGVRGTPGIVFIDPAGKILGVKSFSDPKHPSLEQFASTYTQKGKLQ